jgi:hypothetical protein
LWIACVERQAFDSQIIIEPAPGISLRWQQAQRCW